jgi:hypothetical protein
MSLLVPCREASEPQLELFPRFGAAPSNPQDRFHGNIGVKCAQQPVSRLAHRLSVPARHLARSFTRLIIPDDDRSKPFPLEQTDDWVAKQMLKFPVRIRPMYDWESWFDCDEVNARESQEEPEHP